MKNYISTADLVIWIVLIVARLILCFSILKTRLNHRVLWFSAYVFASSIESVLLFAIAFSASYAVYYHVFYVTSNTISALAFLTLIECGRRVLPGLDLPQKEKAVGLLFAALIAVLIFASLWPMRYVEKRIDLGAYLAIAVTFIFIAAYSRYLGLYWSRLIAGISFSLGLLYLIQGTTRAITDHFLSAPILLIREINQIANVLAVIAWIVVVLSPWGERKMTETDLQKIELAFTRAKAGLDAERVEIA